MSVLWGKGAGSGDGNDKFFFVVRTYLCFLAYFGLSRSWNFGLEVGFFHEWRGRVHDNGMECGVLKLNGREGERRVEGRKGGRNKHMHVHMYPGNHVPDGSSNDSSCIQSLFRVLGSDRSAWMSAGSC